MSRRHSLCSHRVCLLTATIAASWTIAAGANARAGLVGQWSFDSASVNGTTFADSSGRNNHFVLSAGTVPLVPGRFGNAASFDGASSLVCSAPGLAGIYGSFTLGAHVFVHSLPTGGGDAAVLTDPGLQAGITYHVDQRFYGYAGGGSRHVVAPSNLAPGVWRHVVQTFDGASQMTKLYVDGVVVDAIASQTPPTSVNLSSLRIGRVGNASFLAGKVDEAFLFDEVLTDAHIASLASPPPAAPARIWISRSSAQPLADNQNTAGSLEVDLLRAPGPGQGESAEFTIWAQPARDSAGFFKQLQNVSLNLVTTGAPVVDILDTIAIENPGFNINGVPGVDVYRFSETFDSFFLDADNPTLLLKTLSPTTIENGYPDRALGIAAASPTTYGVREGVGLGPWPMSGDPTSVTTSFGPAYRLATFRVKSLTQIGDVNLHLQLGTSGMSNAGEHTVDAQVIFAPPGQSGPVYSAGPSGQRDTTLATDAADILFHVSDSFVGDYNGDLAVNGSDLLLWQRRLGTSVSSVGSGADGNRNGVVDAGDLAPWSRNFGRVHPSATTTTQSVPEPSACRLILAIAGILLGVSRRRCSRVTTYAMFSGVCLFSARADATIWWDQQVNSAWGNAANWSIGSGGGANPSSAENNDVEFNVSSLNGSSVVVNVNTNAYPQGTAFTDSMRFISSGTTSIAPNPTIAIPDPKIGLKGSSARDIFGGRTYGIWVETGAGPVNISSPMYLRGTQVWRNRSNLSVSGRLNLNGYVVDVTGGGTTTLSGDISGGGASHIIKSDGGRLVLTGNNSYSGGTTIGGGGLEINGDANLGTGYLRFANPGDGGDYLAINSSFSTGRQLIFDDSGTIDTRGHHLIWDGPITGLGTLTKTNLGTLEFRSTAKSPGLVTVQGGLLIGSTGLFNSPILNHATTRFSQDVDGTFIHKLSGGGVYEKTGVGIATLENGTSDYTGAFDVHGGALRGRTDTIRGSAVNLYNASAVIFEQSLPGTYDRPITGTGNVYKRGLGVVALTGTNSYNGSTFVEAGVLQGTTSTIRGPVSISSGARVNFNQSAIGDFNNTIAGGGSVSVTGGGRVNLNQGSPSWSGGLSVTSSTVGAAPSTLGTGRVTLDNAMLLMVQGGTIANPVTVTGGSIVSNAGNDVRIDGAITGAGVLEVRGGGVLRLWGYNDYQGGTNVTAGTLVGDSASFGAGPLSMAGGATLHFEQSVDGTFTNPISGAGAVVKSNGGTLTLSGVNSTTGGLTLNGGNLRVANHSIGQGPITINGGNLFTSYLAVDGTPLTTNAPITINPGAGFIETTYSNTTKFNGVVSGAGQLHKTGWGTLVLNGNNTYTGGTLVSLHYLQGNTSSIKGNVSFSTNGLSKGVNFDQAVDGTFANTISGEGTLRKLGSGKLTLTGTNTFSGSAIISGGTLIAGPNSLGTRDAVSGSGDVTVNVGATLGGTPVIQGNLLGGGRVAPGNSPGIITVNGNYTQSATSVLEIEVGGLTPGTQHDQVRVGGVATLDGRHDFPIINGFVPTLGQEITFLDTFDPDGAGGAPRGSIAAGTRPSQAFAPGLQAANPNLAFRIIASPTDVKLRFVAATDIVFDDAANAAADWFVATGWNLNRNPNNEDDTTVGGNITGTAQRVVVNSVDPATVTPANPAGDPVAQVRQLTVRDDFSPITVGIDSGYELASTVGDAMIGDRGAIELNGGTLSIPSTQKVDVYQSGTLAGNGNVIGSVQVGVTAGSNGATLSPGVGTTTGLISISGNYTQGDAGVLEVDLKSAPAGGQFDKVDVNLGAATLGGTLRLDVTDLSSIAANNVYTLVTADAGAGAFTDIEVVDPMSVADDYYFSPFYGTAPASQDALLAALNADEYQSGVRVLSKGDADGDGAVDGHDARVFAAVLVKSDLLGFKLGDGHFAVNNFKDAFNFFTAGEPEGRRIVDFDDVEGFAKRMAASQGVSIEAAYGMFKTAYQQALAAKVPEPRSIVMVILAATTLGLSRRRG